MRVRLEVPIGKQITNPYALIHWIHDLHCLLSKHYPQISPNCPCHVGDWGSGFKGQVQGFRALCLEVQHIAFLFYVSRHERFASGADQGLVWLYAEALNPKRSNFTDHAVGKRPSNKNYKRPESETLRHKPLCAESACHCRVWLEGHPSPCYIVKGFYAGVSLSKSSPTVKPSAIFRRSSRSRSSSSGSGSRSRSTSSQS